MNSAGSPDLDPLLLKHYELLHSTGLWDQFAELQSKNKELQEVVLDATELAYGGSIEKMIDFVLKRMLNKFIPGFLGFFIEPPQGSSIKTYCFRNLKPVEESFLAEDYKLLREFFTQNQHPVAFSLLEYRMENRALTDKLLSYDPEFVVPMLGIGGVHGFVIFGKKVIDRGYDKAEIEYAFRIMRFLSIGIQNSLHHESSITDFKTGLYNHSYFMRRLDQEVARIVRHRSRAGLLLLDLDHFKRLNDTYGHLAGDEILTQVAKTVKEEIRSEDVAARFGGEEFIILAIECSEETLPQVAERIRSAVEGLRVPFKENILSVTVSIGCCFIDEARMTTANDFIHRADKALYRSKSGGRNRTTVHRAGLLYKAEGFKN